MSVDIQIDDFTPCLREKATGKVVPTVYAPMPKQELVGLQKQGWFFNWNADDLKKDEIMKLMVRGQPDIQGLVAFRTVPSDYAVYLSLAESAPHNKGPRRVYDGVGGHLFAVAARKSMECGFGGFLYFEAKNKELVDHYHQIFHAKWIGGAHQFRMMIDEEAARELLEKYTLESE